MEGYYSSDDDVAWGPYTLREAKRDLREFVPSKINRRHTYAGKLKSTSNMQSNIISKDNMNEGIEDIAKLSTEMNNELNISGTSSSEYFTSNETFRSESTAVDEFIGKMKRIIDQTAEITDQNEKVTVQNEEVAGQNEEDTGQNEEVEEENDQVPDISPNLRQNVGSKKACDHSVLNFLDIAKRSNGKLSLFGNVEPTLVENTVILSSDDEEVDESIVKKEISNSYLYENSCYDTSSEVEVIEINDLTADMSDLENSTSCLISDIDSEIQECKEVSANYQDYHVFDVGNTSQRVEEMVKKPGSSEREYLEDCYETCEFRLSGEKHSTLITETNGEHEINSQESSEQFDSNRSEHSSNYDAKNVDDDAPFTSFESAYDKPDIEKILNCLSQDLENQNSETNPLSSNNYMNDSNSSAYELNEVAEDISAKNRDIPDIKIDSVSTSSSNHTSLVLNDTLEEIEMALKFGLDYKASREGELTHEEGKDYSPNRQGYHIDTSTVSYKLPKITSGFSINHDSNIPKLSRNYSKHLKTLSDHQKVDNHLASLHTKVNIPSNENFKVPVTSVRGKLTPNKSPSYHNRKFKDIVSPVGIYIKHSPAAVIKRNVVAKEINTKPMNLSEEKVFTNKETFEMPKVMYRPAKKNIIHQQKEVVLPKSIKKLIYEPGITKHESRVTNKVDDSSLGRRLEMFEAELTCASFDENSLNMTGDTSIISKKKGFL